jgi:hypothetical protein
MRRVACIPSTAGRVEVEELEFGTGVDKEVQIYTRGKGVEAAT